MPPARRMTCISPAAKSIVTVVLGGEEETSAQLGDTLIDIRSGLKAAPVYIKEYTGPTGIVELKGNGNLKNDKEHGGNLYDLCGRNVATSPTLSASVPRKGIYIWDGKKILVR